MKNKNDLPVILKLWPANEMAELHCGSSELFCGNYWDFHPGCMGTDLSDKENGIDCNLKGIWTSNIRGPHALADLVAKHLGRKLVVKTFKRRWSN